MFDTASERRQTNTCKAEVCKKDHSGKLRACIEPSGPIYAANATKQCAIRRQQ
jgi:hypothetical protein